MTRSFYIGILHTMSKLFIRRKSIFEHKLEIVKSAHQKAREARELANKKIEDIYAQLDGKGDRWFLITEKEMDECKEEKK